jgi:hypothetical protein
MQVACFANEAAAPNPAHHAGGVSSTRRDTPRTPHLLKFRKEGVRGLPERVRVVTRSRSDVTAAGDDDDLRRDLTLHP